MVESKLRASGGDAAPCTDRSAVGDRRFVLFELPEEELDRFHDLTLAEREVLAGLLCGLSDGAIAERREIDLGEASTEIACLLLKAGVRSRAELVVWMFGEEEGEGEG